MNRIRFEGTRGSAISALFIQGAPGTWGEFAPGGGEVNGKRPVELEFTVWRVEAGLILSPQNGEDA